MSSTAPDRARAFRPPLAADCAFRIGSFMGLSWNWAHDRDGFGTGPDSRGTSANATERPFRRKNPCKPWLLPWGDRPHQPEELAMTSDTILAIDLGRYK